MMDGDATGRVKELRDSVATRALLSGLTELSARAGHDMVGPLNQAGSLLALFIKRYRSKIDSDADQLLEFLLNSSARMEGVVEGVRHYMAAVAVKSECGSIDMDAALAAARETLRKEIVETQARIVSEPLPAALADGRHMQLVFESLIGNSLKFRQEDRPPSVSITGARAGEMVQITVQDEGIGIDPEYAENVFLPFKRLNGREYPGAGLGLSMARTVIEMNGGQIELVPASQCSGTCFRFTVPPA